MRNLRAVKPWVLLVGVLLVVGGALAVTRSMATTTTPLWTDKPTAAAVPAGTSPWVAVAKADTPAVVNISTTQTVKNPLAFQGPEGAPNDPFQQFFHQFFGNMPRTYQTHSLGSGFIIREDGYVVTNNHVVNDATEITVKLSDGRQFPAKIVGRDPKTDIALLKIEAHGLPAVSFGDSDGLQVGQPVMAIGNPVGLQGTATTGIVSAKGRVIGEGPYDNFIQTDASINPGNSGGPLVNAAGQVVGIDTAIYSQSGGSVGIGFAIPINTAKRLLPQLIARGRATHPWLGISGLDVTPAFARALGLEVKEGVMIANVAASGPAAKAGLRGAQRRVRVGNFMVAAGGDIIVSLDGEKIASVDDLTAFLDDGKKPGDDVRVDLLREGKPVTVSVRLGELPEGADSAK